MKEYTLNPKVKVSDLDMRELPLYNFHAVVVIEPDPETWALPDEEFESLSELLEMQCDLIVDDVIQSYELAEISLLPRANDVEDTLLIIATEGLGDLMYFEPVEQYCSFTVKNNDFQFDKLRLLLDGIAKSHQKGIDWQLLAVCTRMKFCVRPIWLRQQDLILLLLQGIVFLKKFLIILMTF